MSVKASISLSEAQNAYARRLVQEGHFPSVSAVIQHGIELMRKESAATEALRALLAERQAGVFVGADEGKARIDALLHAKRRDRGL